MATIDEVRARLKDRQTKAGALGSAETTVCLDLELVAELEELQSELANTRSLEPEQGRPRHSGPTGKSKPDPAVSELEQRLADKEQEVRDASLRLVFRSIGSSRYQELVNGHPDADESSESHADFLNALADECLAEVWAAKERVTGLDWDEIREGISFGEWDEATVKVLALNRRKVDVPFSLRSSSKTRS